MNGNPPTTLRDQREKHPSFFEAVNTEKLLWATIQHKGISHPEVRDLYLKARSNYGNIILNDYQTVDLHEIEYSLWKLNYKHIDEYRKKIKKVSTSAENTNNLNCHVEGFKLFLFELVDFYKNLIEKFRKTCGILDKTFFFQKNHYLCHRFLVCLGDLSRYVELCKKPDSQSWSFAATYYLEASTVWPYSGNPQNQLALLATYIGDDFLALYHCIRSLAVKEPFPDARDNIMLLFEKNKSSQLQSLSTDAHIDFSKPLKRLSSQIKSHSSMDSSNVNKLGANQNVPLAKTSLWPLFVRMISFFLVKPSFEDLPHTFASTMKELEALLALNDLELNSSLEAYEPFDSSKKGPYRPIQAITMLIFVIHHLIKTSELKKLNEKKDEELSTGITWAWTCTFSFLGHLIQRSQNCCSLLPAVLLFLEWYVGMIDYAETYSADEKVSNAKSYFFGALVDLLSGFDINEPRMVSLVNQTALWEDHELRGFEPVSQSNDLLDFSSRSENKKTFENGNSTRINRVFLASVKIADRLKDSSENLFCYDQSTSKFSKKTEIEIMEEEEVILFKPLTRYNSEPLLAPQNGTHGPPSLSGWVLNRESLNLESEKGSNSSPNKLELAPISEMSHMSISEARNEPYIAPIPSAPFLPKDPVWFKENGILGAPPVNRFLNFSSPQEPLGFIDAYHPPVFGLTSSEWLYRYKNNLSLEIPNSNNHWPVLGNNVPGNFYDGGPRFDLIDKWGNPLLTNRTVYFENPNHRDRVLFGYQRPNIGVGDNGGEVRPEQTTILQQHLKEREWQLQNESTFRGHPYIGGDLI